MIVAAFDLATEAGCCDGAVAGRPRLWTWFLSDAGAGRPERLLMLAKFLRKYFETQPCERVVYELPMPLGMIGSKKDKRIMMSEQSIAFSRGAIGVLEMTCAEHSKPVEGVSAQDARQSVLGWRTNRSGKGTTKARIMQEVTGLHHVAAENHNEADAYIAWAYACARLNPRLAVAYTPLFRDQTGA